MTKARCTTDVTSEERTGELLLDRVNEWAFEHCVPIQATIETTLRCNIRCTHCYNFDRDQAFPSAVGSELSPEEVLRLMSDLRAEGCLFLGLTGGEIFTHPRLYDFLDHSRRLHLSVRLLSNGTLLSADTVARLAKYPHVMSVDLSLYGATPAVHDSITQVAGSFVRTWEGAERLRDRGMGVRLKFILMRQNVHEAEAMIEKAQTDGFSFAVDHTITGRHDGTRGSLGTRIREQEIEPLLRGPLRHLVRTREYSPDDLACSCARGNCAISSQGDVYPCIGVPYPAGNVREKPFSEIWKHSPVFQRIRGLRLKDYPHCAPCALKPWCARNRGPNFLASGEYTGIDPFVCATAEAVRRLALEESAPT
jgi:radical SAM protein with 4Fe4S-binding SPASM domain